MWACVLLPQLALDGVLRRRAESGPLVLVDGPLNQRRIVAANAQARAAGLHPGQKLAAAQALLAQFEALPYAPDEVARWQQFLAGVAYRYSSQVALLPHALVLEIGRSEQLFGPWPVLARRLREELLALGFRHRLSAAPTPQGAYVLAGLKDGATAFSRERLLQALAAVPLGKSRLPAAAVDALPRMGVRQLGALLRLPRDGLQRRFGIELVQAVDELLGDLPPRLDVYTPPRQIDWRLELSHEVENLAALVFPLRRLCGDLAAWLSACDGGVQRFVLRLEHREGGDTDVSVGMLATSRESDVLFEAARGRLERVSLRAPVLALRLQAADLPSFVPAGKDLFDTRPAHALPFEQLRERLRARLGDTAVYRWSSTIDPRPERSQSREAGVAAPLEPRARPTWLLERPIPLRGEVHIVAGPERLETGWWDDGDLRRDYYIVQTSLGQRAWAFCAPDERSGWMLHGWFA